MSDTASARRPPPSQSGRGKATALKTKSLYKAPKTKTASRVSAVDLHCSTITIIKDGIHARNTRLVSNPTRYNSNWQSRYTVVGSDSAICIWQCLKCSYRSW